MAPPAPSYGGSSGSRYEPPTGSPYAPPTGSPYESPSEFELDFPPPPLPPSPPPAPAPTPARPAPGSSSPGGASSTVSYRTVEPALLRSLFDLKFDKPMTPGIIKILYILVMVMAGLVAVMFLLSGITALRFGSSLGGLVSILLAPVAFLLITVYGRVGLEVVAAFFKMGDEVSRIAQRALED